MTRSHVAIAALYLTACAVGGAAVATPAWFLLSTIAALAFASLPDVSTLTTHAEQEDE